MKVTKTIQSALHSLKAYPGNPRVGDIKALEESLKANGQYKPIVVQEGTNYILAGNHLFQAAQNLSFDTILVTWVTDVTDEEAKKIVLADNRTSQLGAFDGVKLLDLLSEIPDLEGTGYDEIDFDALMTKFGAFEEKKAEDEIPPLKKVAICKPGETWLLGKHTITVSSPFEAASYPSQKAGLLLSRPKIGEKKSHFEYTAKYKSFLSFCQADLAPSAGVYLVNTEKMLFEELRDFRDQGFVFKQQLVWVNSALQLGFKEYRPQHVTITYGKNQGLGGIWKGVGDDSVFNKSSLDLESMTKQELISHILTLQGQSTVKTSNPVRLFQTFINNSTKVGELVLDPFLGTGDTLIACEQSNRTCYGIVEDELYATLVCERYQKLTGELPVLNGKPVNFIEGE